MTMSMADTRSLVLYLFMIVLITALFGQDTSTMTTRSFYYISPSELGTIGPVRVGGASVAKSLSSCMNKCLNRYPPCPSVMYNTDTGLCTPSLWLSTSEAPPNSTEGKLYLGFHCGPFPQFTMYFNGDAAACLAFITELKTYEDASLNCNSLGGYLFAGQTPEKAAIPPQVVKNYTWIGLDDLVEEGRWVWRADGTELNMTTNKADVFPGHEPNGGTRENCVILREDRGFKGNDMPCGSPSLSLCEKPI